MSWFLVILFLSLTHGSVSDASHHDKKFPSAVVVGTVFCDTCFQQQFSVGSHFISGASVAVECKDENSIPRFKKEVKTNEHGEFKVQLPFKVRKHVRRIKGCTFKLVSSSESHCAVASDSTSSSVSLKTRKQGEHIFSVGLFSFKPTEKPNYCNQKQSVPNCKPHDCVKNKFSPGKTLVFKHNPTKSSHNSQLDKNLAEDFFFPPFPFLPPIFPYPFQPPPIIPNPFQPPPLIPNPFQPPPLIPNPFQPPPLIPNPFQPPRPPLIPNPFQPPSPPPLFPNPFQPPPSPPPLFPNPFQPPPSPPPSFFPPFPPIPFLTPPPPPPPPPPFFHVPPLFPPLPPLFPPFPPLFPPPHIPGIPIASSKNNSP